MKKTKTIIGYLLLTTIFMVSSCKLLYNPLFRHDDKREEKEPTDCALLKSKTFPEVVSFKASANWDNYSDKTSIKSSTSARALAEIRVLENGGGLVRVTVVARSTAFKIYSWPLASVIVTTNTGAIIDMVEANAKAMDVFSKNVSERTGGG